MNGARSNLAMHTEMGPRFVHPPSTKLAENRVVQIDIALHRAFPWPNDKSSLFVPFDPNDAFDLRLARYRPVCDAIPESEKYARASM